MKPRQGRGKRDADGDWPSNEWDELSDVDYWAELASDRPLTTASPGEPSARSGRGDQGRGDPGRGESRSDAGASRSRGHRSPGQSDRDRPARDADRVPGQPLVPAVKRKPDLAAAERTEDFSGTGSRRAASLGRTERLHAVPSGAGAAGPGPAHAGPTSTGLTSTGLTSTGLTSAGRTGAGPGQDARQLVPDPDDPLTSPSFPRIADDSRSYRRSRTASPDQPSGRGADDAPHRSAQSAAQGRSREQAYPALPPVDPIRGIDALSQPHSYPRPAGSDSDYAAASADYTRPSADPYRSVPSSSPVSGGYQVPAAVSVGGYEASTTEYSVPVRPAPAATVGYPDSRGPAQAGYQSPGGYPAPAGAGPSQYQGPSGAHPAAYPPAAPASGGYGRDSYSGDTVARGSYQPSALDSGYHDPGYHDPGYHDAGYQVPAADLSGYQQARPAPSALPETGFSGYPAAPATSSYASPADTSGYGPGQSGLPGGYGDYAGPGPASGSHSLPDPGYLPSGYAPAPAPASPGFPGSLPVGHAESGYPAYPAPLPAVHGSPYPEPGGQLPGLPAGYQEPTYLPGPYDPDPAGYTVPAPQPGYAGADPYAVDPYGYPANGSGGH